jgi:hypothetical protein
VFLLRDYVGIFAIPIAELFVGGWLLLNRKSAVQFALGFAIFAVMELLRHQFLPHRATSPNGLGAGQYIFAILAFAHTSLTLALIALSKLERKTAAWPWVYFEKSNETTPP